MGSYYPVMLELQDQPVLVVGGGRVAERKIRALLDAHARITVISPFIRANIEAWKETGKITVINRKYVPGDVQNNYRIVFAATDDDDVNEQIASEAKAKGLLVNVVSDPQASNFIDPASFKRGKLHIAVSTSGASPVLAAKIKKQLEAHYGDEYERALDFLYTLRQEVKMTFTDDLQRKTVFRYIAEEDWLHHFRQGDESVGDWLDYFSSKLKRAHGANGKDEYE